MLEVTQDACSGNNPEALAGLKAMGIGCNGEKLTPNPNAKFANQAAEAFYELARQRPDFRVTHECQPDAPCQMVETATRSPGRDGQTLKDTFFTYEDGSQKKVWCAQNTGDLSRVCSDAADGSDQAVAKSWVEAYFPKRRHWVRFELDNPACKGQQQSEYYIDNTYVTCIVAKFDDSQPGATPAPDVPLISRGTTVPAGGTAQRPLGQPASLPHLSRNAPLPATLSETFRAMLAQNGKRCAAITDHVWVAADHLSIMCDRRLRVSFMNDGYGWQVGQPHPTTRPQLPSPTPPPSGVPLDNPSTRVQPGPEVFYSRNKPFEPGVDDVPIAYYVCPETGWALGIVFLPRAVALYEINLHFSRGWRIGVQNQLNLFCDQRVTLIRRGLRC
jgi:hypothetical protein